MKETIKKNKDKIPTFVRNGKGEKIPIISYTEEEPIDMCPRCGWTTRKIHSEMCASCGVAFES